MNGYIIEKILGLDIHTKISNGENKVISLFNLENAEISINKNDGKYPYKKISFYIGCDDCDIKYCDNEIKGAKMIMNGEEVIKKRVAKEILSMIETVCFSDEFKEYRINNGSNGERDLIIENIKNIYGVG